jgi:hypothetical protein
MSQIATLESVVDAVKIKEGASTQETWRCPNPICFAGAWNVQLLSACDPLWQVSNETGGGFWLVAGVTPACPACGAGLPILPTN